MKKLDVSTGTKSVTCGGLPLLDDSFTAEKTASVPPRMMAGEELMIP